MKMGLKRNKKTTTVKRLSDYIMSFAFLYSSLICFTEAASKWDEHRVLAVIIFICGLLSFIAVFRWKISYLYNNFKNKKYDAKKN